MTGPGDTIFWWFGVLSAVFGFAFIMVWAWGKLSRAFYREQYDTESHHYGYLEARRKRLDALNDIRRLEKALNGRDN